jgi:hypothetical protein
LDGQGQEAPADPGSLQQGSLGGAAAAPPESRSGPVMTSCRSRSKIRVQICTRAPAAWRSPENKPLQCVLRGVKIRLNTLACLLFRGFEEICSAAPRAPIGVGPPGRLFLRYLPIAFPDQGSNLRVRNIGKIQGNLISDMTYLLLYRSCAKEEFCCNLPNSQPGSIHQRERI